MDEREIEIGDLVTVATAGPQIDGIVFDLPRGAKAVVAVIDRTKGPVLRSVARDALGERTEAGADDPALHALIRRTPAPARSGRGGTSGGGAPRSGFRRSATHRPTGR
jgi:hypothetical protein